MSLILGLTNDKFVYVAGDKRETFVDGSGFIDGCKKVHKGNNFIYALCGSTELSNLFNLHQSCNSLKDFINYSTDFYNKLNESKTVAMGNWIKQQFDLSLISGGFINSKPYMSFLQITWKENGILFGELQSTETTPICVTPCNADDIFDYIVKNYPKTIESSKSITEKIINSVSKVNNTVSQQFDIEYIMQ